MFLITLRFYRCVRQLEIKVLDIVGARCNHEVYSVVYFTLWSRQSSVPTDKKSEKMFHVTHRSNQRM